VRDSVAFPRLSRSAPRWITSLLDSINVLLVAFVVSIIAKLSSDRFGITPVICLNTAIWGLSWFAVWLLTRPEPGERSAASRCRRWGIRLLVSIPYLAFLIEEFVRRTDLWEWAGTLALGVTLFLVPATTCYYLELRRAARRLPNPALAWQALVVGVGLGLSHIPFVLAAGGRFWWSLAGLIMSLPNVAMGSVGAAWDTAASGATGLDLSGRASLMRLPNAVFTVWALVLLVQFRIAFGVAARRSAAGPAQPASERAK
jgi:hypothetical protein